MAKSSKSSATQKTGWLPSLLGAALLVFSGFSLGLVVGIVKEEPELVVGHLSGRSQAISWATEVAPETAEVMASAEPDFALGREERPVPSTGSEFSAGGLIEPGTPELDLPSARSTPPSAGGERLRERHARTKSKGIAVAQLPRVSAARDSGSGGGFSVQVGAFKASQPAERVAADLRQKGYDVYVVSAPSGGKGLWRVRVGPVASKAEADRVSNRLKREERMTPFVLSEGGG